jgi:hypothetical protein
MSRARQMKAAAGFVDAQLKVGRVAFSLRQLIESTGLTPIAARSQLHRLGERIARVPSAHSYFVIVTPEHQAPGAPPVEWWLDDYFRWLQRPYYLALQSAASALGSNPQAIQVTQVMTDGPRKPIEVGRLKITFFTKRRMARTPTQQLPNAYAPTRVSTPAATVFDLVRYAAKIGGIGRAVETLRPLLSNVRPADLRVVIESEDETASAQRLGFVLERLGHSKLADVVDNWLPGKRPVTVLAAGRPAQGDSANRWRVLDNSAEFLS